MGKKKKRRKAKIETIKAIGQLLAGIASLIAAIASFLKD